MKKNKLYTFHRGMPAFMVDRETHNIFDGLTLGQSSLMTNKSLLGNSNNSNPFGIKLLSASTITPRVDWSNSAQAAVALEKNKANVVSPFINNFIKVIGNNIICFIILIPHQN